MCQLFVTANIIVVFYKIYEIYIFCKESFNEQRKNKADAYKSSRAPGYALTCSYRILKNISKLAKHKLNYTRICKDNKYREYINYSNVIINIVNKYFISILNSI